MAKGPAQLITAATPASARSSEAGSSTDAWRVSSPDSEASFVSLPASRPDGTGTNPLRT